MPADQLDDRDPTGPPPVAPDQSVQPIVAAFRRAVRKYKTENNELRRWEDDNDLDPADWETYCTDIDGEVLVDGRLEWGPRIRMTYPQWAIASDHPQWRDYLDSIAAGPVRPFGAQGFEAWLTDPTQPQGAAGRDAQPGWWTPTAPDTIPSGTRRPFLCDADTALPAGWVRGDPASETGATVRVAFDPRRHTVVRCAGDVSPATGDCLARAGFEQLEVPGEPATFYVRDRVAQHRGGETPQPAVSRQAGRSR